MVTDQTSDLLTRIRNAQRVGHKSVRVFFSKQVESVLKVLVSEGFVLGYEEKDSSKPGFKEYEVDLKYFETGEPMMGTAKSVSKPGRRIYLRHDRLPQVHRGLGIAIVSTSQGVMSDRQARNLGIGGEVLALVHS